ncbi:HYR domain-containing protein, partial [Arthrospira platensis SPKY1]|nr:HYR domain-containing protein [Arthrospira platensis SPKY1]
MTWPVPQAADACTAEVTVVQTGGPAQGSFLEVGTVYTIEYTATDGCGNSAICTFTVEVLDVQAPEIDCPGNQFLPTDPGVCYATVQTGPGNPLHPVVLYDNCDYEIEYQLTGATNSMGWQSGMVPGGTQFNLGDTRVRYRVTDPSGNQVICSFWVYVTDEEAPTVVACPDDIEVDNDL